MLLTATVPQAEDRDGYQAAHLFFMPRDSWEMDLGQGMLFDEAHYTIIDREALTGGYSNYSYEEQAQGGNDARDYAPSLRTEVRGDEQGSAVQAPDGTRGIPAAYLNSSGPTARRTPPAASPVSDGIPVTLFAVLLLVLFRFSKPLFGTEIRYHYESWLCETPSPPPRAALLPA